MRISQNNQKIRLFNLCHGLTHSLCRFNISFLFFTKTFIINKITIFYSSIVLNDFSSLSNKRSDTSALLIKSETRDTFPVEKIRKEVFRKVFNVWTKSHFSNFEVGWRTFPWSRKCLSVVLK